MLPNRVRARVACLCIESHGLGFPLYGCSVIPTNGTVIVVVGFGRVVADAHVVIGASECARVLHMVRRGHVTSLVRVVEIVQVGAGVEWRG